MGFNAQERALMLQLKGVGPTVIERLEQLGFSSLQEMAGRDAQAINRAVAEMLRASCWANSPQARQAIACVVELANQRDVA
ncbi:MAG: helix-hairpin-helix domain-containing protein [Burkholderiaceae bacterium]